MRSIEKAISEFDRIHKGMRGIAYVTDFKQLIELSESKQKAGQIDIYSLVNNTFKFAFTIGYRCRKREERKQQNNETREKIK